MSSVTVLGVPAEYYIYGTMFTWYIIPYLLVPAIVTWLFMPVFYDLNINSTYEVSLYYKILSQIKKEKSKHSNKTSCAETNFLHYF